MVSANSTIDEDHVDTAGRRFSNDIRCIGSFFLSFADSEVEKAYINDMTSQAMQARKPFARGFGFMCLAGITTLVASSSEETAEAEFPVQLMLPLAVSLAALSCLMTASAKNIEVICSVIVSVCSIATLMANPFRLLRLGLVDDLDEGTTRTHRRCALWQTP